MKKYNIVEVLEELRKDSTKEFKYINEVLKTTMKIYVNSTGYVMVKTTGCEDGFDGNININSEWTEIEKPVTFIEALNSKKLVKVEHELLNEFDTFKHFCGIYSVLKSIMFFYSEKELREIINEGKWYIEN